MNNKIKKISTYLVLFAFLAVPIVSSAAEFRAGDETFVGRDEHILNDLYIAGGSVMSSGIVAGDLFAGGGSIVVNGDVGADLVAGGGNVSILSNVGDDVRVSGGSIVISGNIGGDLMAGGGQITTSGPGVAGDVIIGGGDIRIEAPVMGNLTVGAGSVYINAPVHGNIKIEADVVKLGSSAVISGNMTYRAKREMAKDPNATIVGKVTFEPRAENMLAPAAFAAIFSLFLFWKFLALLVSALLLGLVFRRYSKAVVNHAERRPWLSLGRGLVTLAVFCVVPVLLMVTVVGIPLGILGLLGFASLMIFSCIVTPIIVGSVVFRYFSKRDLEVTWKTIVTGVFVYLLLGLVPFVGHLAQTIIMLIAVGSIATIKWRMLQEWR